MLRRLLPSALSLGLWIAAVGPAAASPLPSVARPTYVLDGKVESHSTVFFIPAPGDEVGVVAVGAAHSFDLAKLGRAGEVRFERPASKSQVAISSRYLVKPGKPFRMKGGTLRSDYIVFALDLAPSGVTVLEPDPGRLRSGTRVRLLGIPNAIAQDEDDLFGTVVEVGAERIEVELDVPGDLRGWGGAPVVSAETGQLHGILEGAWPVAGTYRVGVAPISGVLEALETPLAEGLGQPFSFYQAYAWDLDPPRGNPFGQKAQQAKKRDDDPLPNAPKVARTEPPPLRHPPKATGPPRVGRPEDVGPAELRVTIEYPGPDAVVGNRGGGFLAGHAMVDVGDVQRFDVVFVLDTSGSTVVPTGADINGNGVVGRAPLGAVGRAFSLGSTDPGDSILSAEILAARHLLHGLDPRTTRVGVVSFAGVPPDEGFMRRAPDAAVTEEPLTADYGRIEDALNRIFRRGPSGGTHMAAGVDRATIELLGLRGSLSQSDADSEKVVLFFTDGQPTLPYSGGSRGNVEAVLRAADRARRGEITIHSFALGPDALEGPMATVEMAGRTDGQFTPVRNPGELVQVVEVVRFTDVETLRVQNLTNNTEADHVQLNADGSWTALVPLAIGINEIEVLVIAEDGRTATEHITLQHAPGEIDPAVPRELVTQRNRLLERKLLELRRGRIASEREAAEEARKELKIEIQRERAAAAERAEQQRKELDIQIGSDEDGA
ncbi:MAG: VWA domain-containing protein [Deltaproteobacteria bacterium]|nr:VWA domain-containing protein [Deltaproteobacteria bacterium]